MSQNDRSIRIFLSSTFRDFGEERDLLVRRVFPSLRARLKERFVELVDVDLRWGITAEQAERGREVRFAPAPGVCETGEGPARYETGDAIVTGDAGESWCTTRSYFDANYEPVEGTEAGQDGTYAKRRQEVLAFQLGAPRRIPLSGDRGILSGKAGDWVVDYGSGNLAIVAQDLFPRYFSLDPGAL